MSTDAAALRPAYPLAPPGPPVRLRHDPITGERYYSPAFARAEWEHMWTRIWHIGGLMAELEEPGDYVVHDFLRESVIIVRQPDGAIKAFHNACRHRGNQLVQGQAGSVPHGFACPYHGWRYGLDGLVRQAQDPENFARGNPCGKVGLKEIPCASWGGFAWYSMDPAAPALADYLAPIPALLASRGIEQMTRVLWTTTRVNTNWKFAPDNFNESYHLPTVHPQMQQIVDEDYRNTVFEMHPAGHNRMIEQGQPSLRATHPNEVEPAWEDMLRAWDLDPADFAGRSRDGRLALQRQKRRLGPARGHAHFASLHDDELTDYFHHTLFPNVTLTATCDGLHLYRTEPDPRDPEWCTFDYWYFVPPVAGRDEVQTIFGARPFAPAAHETFTYGQGAGSAHPLGNFLDQDLAVAVSQQNGFHSRGYQDAYLSDQEDRIRRFHEVLNDYLEGRR
ncbi:MAG TPA: aromatic ring-hydroxylating dioxygenase subunit alpha [Novosphingobium sp.]|nr:aromatic ring-hydroxylating dioxygenase subunit alpha [Novosphingobium sp.]